ncbi:polysaccharide biosynthesis protein [Vagococcus acidifermentans]|uniref:Polysaccharide biosynthesis protein n=1 Tax=Vagococcus acidifermentans TaxID=564710 RepID=A0A430ATS5_9ENTE|nr:nucleoside-diphosphate sugar epimerase/dehydratase [Vagococcus acidifermentans]RSU11469.1 polysaccharide biosynthesis protein [Vagococcus acidifermentans]
MKVITLLIVDTLSILIANGISYVYLVSLMPVSRRFVLISTLVQIAAYIIFGFSFKIFNRINRYTNLNELIAIFFAVLFSSLLELVFFKVLNPGLSQIFTFSVFFLTLLFILMSRIVWRLIVEYKVRRLIGHPSDLKNALIIGAGEAGQLLYTTLKNNPNKSHMNIIGFIDDDPSKQHAYLDGKKVLGTTEKLPEIVEHFGIQMITIAIPSLDAENYERILDIVNPLDVEVNTIPSFEELASGQVAVTKLREIDVVDLLGREEIKLDMTSIKNHITNKVILVTGAGGSIGSEICRQLMPFSPRRLLLLGHGENSIYLIEKDLRMNFGLKSTEIIPIIADIQDRERIDRIMNTYRPDIIYHAAAHKHVPMMEYNPTEAVKNNIFGTKNVAESAIAHDVSSFVMISTDKAVNPPNVMGATKRIAEMIVTGLDGAGTTKFSAVRFGNVLGSRGSVIPLFKEQVAKGGPLTVTDFRMTRYFMTIPEASRLMIQAGALAKGGEIFILDMGDPVRIYDLAQKIIKLSGYEAKEIEIIETGMRPGEKLFEELLVDKERSDQQIYDKIFVGNVKGFDYETVLDKITHLPADEESLKNELIKFANASSKG